MNKTIISWSHYLYATITASVLAYVTVMDSSKESDESAISMLPNLDTSIRPEEPVTVEEPVAVEEPVEEPVAVAEPVEVPVAEPVAVAEQVKESQVGSSRRKLKNNKTKTSKKNSKTTKTHRRH
jgi:hypothetical protein